MLAAVASDTREFVYPMTVSHVTSHLHWQSVCVYCDACLLTDRCELDVIVIMEGALVATHCVALQQEIHVSATTTLDSL